MRLKGGCLCGAVSYEGSGEPAFIGSCYCTDCQQKSGAGHVTVVAVPQAAVEIRGEPRLYIKKSDSGNEVARAFCPTCGSNLYSTSESLPGMILLGAGGLENSSDLKVQAAVYASSARPWDPPPEGLQAFPKMPTG